MTINTSNVSCIILAGGEGKRAKGADKGLLLYKEKPLIQHVIDAISPQTDEIIISANRNLETYRQFTDKVFNDSFESYQGPLAGIASCLHHCKNEWALVVACDMPALPNNLVERLSAHNRDKTVCIVTVKTLHQLALLIKTDASDSIIDKVNNHQLKLITWVESVPYNTVTFDDNPDAFLNLNTLPETHKTQMR